MAQNINDCVFVYKEYWKGIKNKTKAELLDWDNTYYINLNYLHCVKSNRS